MSRAVADHIGNAALAPATKRWLLAIVATAAALRLVPVWFGLPYLNARPDEAVATGVAVAILAGDPNPHFFHWPSLTFYLFAGVFWIAGLVRDAAALSAQECLVIGRTVVALAGTATILVLFRMARRIAGDAVALVAAALLAVAILHVRDSHFAMTDVLMTLLATTSLALIVRAMDEDGERQALRWFAAAGLAAGLAASTKYNAAAVAASMAAAQILLLARGLRARALLPSLVYGLLFVAGFVLATPYAVLDFTKFREDVIFDITHLSGGHGVDLGRGWIYHLRRTLPYGLGPTAFAAAIIGIYPLARKHPRHAFVLGAFVAALYVSIGSGYTVFFRYILPLIPVACLAAALGVRQCADWLPAGGHKVLYPLLLAVIVGPGLINSIWFDALLARTDSRVVAAEWIKPRLRPEHSLHDAGGEYTRLDLAEADYHPWYFDPATGRFRGAQEQTPDWLVLYQSQLFTYARTPWQLQTLASTRYKLVHTVRASTGRRRDAVYDLQDAFFLPVWGFWTVERPGPTIDIYMRNDAQ